MRHLRGDKDCEIPGRSDFHNYLFSSFDCVSLFLQVEESVLSSGVNKKLVLILNKIGELELAFLMFGEHSILSNVH